MEYRTLGHTDIKVSSICLGTMTWGQQNTEAEGHEQIDYALAMGINFLDTAEMYAVPPKAETQGSTERIIGTWLEKSGKRDDIILATKVAGRADFDWMRDDGAKAQQTRPQIEEAINKSLTRLKTDYIDLYQLHWPDRPMKLFGSNFSYTHISDEINRIEDILEVLGDLQKSGKVRHFGLSNETPWGIMKFLHHAEIKGLPRMVSVQNAYNLINRVYEMGSSEIYFHENVGLLAYSPLAQGYLSGKYQNGALPKGSRKELFNRLQRYETPGADNAIESYLAIAKKYGIDVSQLANQFVTTRPFVTSNIIGATTMAQLKLAVTSVDVDLTDEIVAEIEAVHARAPNVCP
ncbi:MAG: aldo/keto reductase [Alphaproteobacteria bacterium]|nr:aldo/keto reductase [Alphaproteobacteria bacterium]